MSYWGKVIGGFAGLVVGGPFGAVAGAALGHAVDEGSFNAAEIGGKLGAKLRGINPARIAAMTGRRDQVFALGVVVLAAKLAKCDGAVKREEIDAFKRFFRIPPEAAHDIGRLFDQARDSHDDFEQYARQLGESFADNRGMLEDVLAALFGIARADGEITGREQDFLQRTAAGFGLDQGAWARASGRGSRAAPTAAAEEDPYVTLGVERSASDEALRLAWRKLMRENHPDSLASRGVPPEFIARATQKVAGINAAWDRIKRERGI